MAGEAKKAKGRAKEAGGAASGNERLRREGSADQARGEEKKREADSVQARLESFLGASPIFDRKQ
jgi:uncharacterized protein YjbJ (UPF0337 family)